MLGVMMSIIINGAGVPVGVALQRRVNVIKARSINNVPLVIALAKAKG